ncbi:MAG: hypothetical protein HC834_10200 [Rhodospirillales bacterium]|nr:hypothetical protein [Rhodospirillales bacterium]
MAYEKRKQDILNTQTKIDQLTGEIAARRSQNDESLAEVKARGANEAGVESARRIMDESMSQMQESLNELTKKLAQLQGDDLGLSIFNELNRKKEAGEDEGADPGGNDPLKGGALKEGIDSITGGGSRQTIINFQNVKLAENLEIVAASVREGSET